MGGPKRGLGNHVLNSLGNFGKINMSVIRSQLLLPLAWGDYRIEQRSCWLPKISGGLFVPTD